MTMKKVLTIAGSDSSGGAGIQADLKTFQEHNVYGMTALTTIVTMSPDGWNHSVNSIDTGIVEKQIDTILSIGIDAMKTGMLGSVAIIELVAKKIDQYNLHNTVIDPVMVCKGEDEVLQPENTDAIIEFLLPRTMIATPNLFEAGQLAKTGPIKNINTMKEAARIIHDLGAKHVVIKGGTEVNKEKAIDLYFDGIEFVLLENNILNTTYTHGAGCTFAAAITANMAQGKSVKEAVSLAKEFVTSAIAKGWKLNEYVGPVNHGAHNY